MSVPYVAAMLFTGLIVVSLVAYLVQEIFLQLRGQWVKYQADNPQQVQRAVKTLTWVSTPVILFTVCYILAWLLVDTGWWPW